MIPPRGFLPQDYLSKIPLPGFLLQHSSSRIPPPGVLLLDSSGVLHKHCLYQLIGVSRRSHTLILNLVWTESWIFRNLFKTCVLPRRHPAFFVWQQLQFHNFCHGIFFRRNSYAKEGIGFRSRGSGPGSMWTQTFAFTQTSSSLKFIPKFPCLSSLKFKIPVNSKKFLTPH